MSIVRQKTEISEPEKSTQNQPNYPIQAKEGELEINEKDFSEDQHNENLSDIKINLSLDINFNLKVKKVTLYFQHVIITQRKNKNEYYLLRNQNKITQCINNEVRKLLISPHIQDLFYECIKEQEDQLDDKENSEIKNTRKTSIDFENFGIIIPKISSHPNSNLNTNIDRTSNNNRNNVKVSFEKIIKNYSENQNKNNLTFELHDKNYLKTPVGEFCDEISKKEKSSIPSKKNSFHTEQTNMPNQPQLTSSCKLNTLLKKRNHFIEENKDLSNFLMKENNFKQKKNENYCLPFSMTKRVKDFWDKKNNTYPFIFKHLRLQKLQKNKKSLLLIEKQRFDFKRVNPNQGMNN